MELLSNFINGDYVNPKSNNYLDVFEPATGQVYCQVPNSNGDDIHLAVNSAIDAFPEWSSLSLDERSLYLKTIAEMIESRLDEFAKYESRDTGKPISLARVSTSPGQYQILGFLRSMRVNLSLSLI